MFDGMRPRMFHPMKETCRFPSRLALSLLVEMLQKARVDSVCHIANTLKWFKVMELFI